MDENTIHPVKRYLNLDAARRREHRRSYRARNRDAFNEKQRAYAARNPDKRRNYSRAYYAKNKDAIRERNREYYLANADRMRERGRKWYRANRERAAQKHKEWSKRNAWRRLGRSRRGRYRITPDQFEELFVSQGRRCAICRIEKPAAKHGWHVDHCHKTQRLRAILCHNCNCGIGHAKESVDILRKMIVYLEHHSSGEHHDPSDSRDDRGRL